MMFKLKKIAGRKKRRAKNIKQRNLHTGRKGGKKKAPAGTKRKKK